MFVKTVQRLFEPGAFFFGDIGSGFDGDVVLLGKVVDGCEDQSAPVEIFRFFLSSLHSTSIAAPASLQGSHQQTHHTFATSTESLSLRLVTVAEFENWKVGNLAQA
jgi:hypothetical protein